jgi:hypothetical protein
MRNLDEKRLMVCLECGGFRRPDEVNDEREAIAGASDSFAVPAFEETG